MDLLLDVNVVVDLCTGREPHFQVVRDAVAACRARGGRVWLYAGSVQTLEYVTRSELCRQWAKQGIFPTPRQVSHRTRELLRELAKDMHWLAALSGEGDVYGADDPEDEQLIRALRRFAPGTIRLLTRDAAVLAKCPDAVSPVDFLRLGEKASPLEFMDLKAQQDAIRPHLEEGIHTVLHHGRYILGPEVARLERAVADYVGVKHAVGCSSGTDALLLALMAYGVGPGDAVVTTPFSFIATAEVIALLGAVPVFADIDPETYNINPVSADRAVRALRDGRADLHPLVRGEAYRNIRPRGIIAVDLYGLPADYDALRAVCEEHGLFLIEDAAQSFGAEYRGRKAGSLGDVGATSFFPAKPLGGYGDGGMVFTDRDDIADVCRSLVVHGKGTDKYDNVRIGLNARLDTLQAAILQAKFEAFPAELQARQDVAARYTEGLRALDGALTPPVVPEGSLSAWAQYTVRARDPHTRSALIDRLKKAGIPTAVYYPKPLHLQGAFASLGYRPGDFPVAEEASRTVFSLPFGPYMAQTAQARVLDALQGL